MYIILKVNLMTFRLSDYLNYWLLAFLIVVVFDIIPAVIFHKYTP